MTMPSGLLGRVDGERPMLEPVVDGSVKLTLTGTLPEGATDCEEPEPDPLPAPVEDEPPFEMAGVLGTALPPPPPPQPAIAKMQPNSKDREILELIARCPRPPPQVLKEDPERPTRAGIVYGPAELAPRTSPALLLKCAPNPRGSPSEAAAAESPTSSLSRGRARSRRRS
jgi:hypothetical protein